MMATKQMNRAPGHVHRTSQQADDVGHRLLHVVIGLFLVLASATPYLFGPLLGVLLAGCGAVAVLNRLTLPPVAMGWVLALSSLGAFGVLHGTINGHEGATSLISIFVVEPILLGLLFPMIYQSALDIERLLLALDAALLVTALVGFLLFLSTSTGLSLVPGILIDPRYHAIDLTTNVLSTNYQGYNSLVFLAPYAGFRCGVRNVANGLTARRRTMLAVAALSGVVFAGRQVLYLSTPAALLIAWFLTRSPGRTQRQAGNVIGRFAIAGMTVGVLGISLTAIGLSARSALSRTIAQVSLQDQAGVRQEQSRILLHSWLDSPVFGHGTGTTISGYERSHAAPWQFELSYHLLLVSFGVLGVALLAIWSAWIIHSLRTRDAALRNASGCVMAGFIGAVLAASTNPYFFKIDGIWMAFVPFAVAVAASVTRHGSSAPSAAQ